MIRAVDRPRFSSWGLALWRLRLGIFCNLFCDLFSLLSSLFSLLSSLISLLSALFPLPSVPRWARRWFAERSVRCLEGLVPFWRLYLGTSLFSLLSSLFSLLSSLFSLLSLLFSLLSSLFSLPSALFPVGSVFCFLLSLFLPFAFGPEMSLQKSQERAVWCI